MAGSIEFVVVFLNFLTFSNGMFHNLVSEDFVEAKHFIFWPNGTVPFYINPQHFDHQQSLTIMRWLTTFAFRSCIKFLPTLVPPENNQHVMLFENPNGLRKCYIDNKGYSVDGPHVVILGYDCLTSPNIEMMIMKNLGFPFEHNRQIRDVFIDVQIENVEPSAFELFTKDTKLPAELRALPYDINSVMHFDTRQFSKNGHRTIIFKESSLVQERNSLSPTDLRKIEMVYGPECRNRDRLEKVELCQNYPGAARRKRQADEVSTVKSTEQPIPSLPLNDATVNLRVNRDITPPISVVQAVNPPNPTATTKDDSPPDSTPNSLPDIVKDQEEVSASLKELGVEAEVEEIVEHVHRVTALALKNARLKYCNETKLNLRGGAELVKTNTSDILSIVENIADYSKAMVLRATANLTEFCESSRSIEAYQRDSCPFFDKSRCPKRYKSTLSGPVKVSTNHRPVYKQSTRHWDLKKKWLRDGNDTTSETPVTEASNSETFVTKSVLRMGTVVNLNLGIKKYAPTYRSSNDTEIRRKREIFRRKRNVASLDAKVDVATPIAFKNEVTTVPSKAKVAENKDKVSRSEATDSISKEKDAKSEDKVVGDDKVAKSNAKDSKSADQVSGSEAIDAKSKDKVAKGEDKVAKSDATDSESTDNVAKSVKNVAKSEATDAETDKSETRNAEDKVSRSETKDTPSDEVAKSKDKVAKGDDKVADREAKVSIDKAKDPLSKDNVDQSAPKVLRRKVLDPVGINLAKNIVGQAKKAIDKELKGAVQDLLKANDSASGNAIGNTIGSLIDIEKVAIEAKNALSKVEAKSNKIVASKAKTARTKDISNGGVKLAASPAEIKLAKSIVGQAKKEIDNELKGAFQDLLKAKDSVSRDAISETIGSLIKDEKVAIETKVALSKVEAKSNKIVASKAKPAKIMDILNGGVNLEANEVKAKSKVDETRHNRNRRKAYSSAPVKVSQPLPAHNGSRRQYEDQYDMFEDSPESVNVSQPQPEQDGRRQYYQEDKFVDRSPRDDEAYSPYQEEEEEEKEEQERPRPAIKKGRPKKQKKFENEQSDAEKYENEDDDAQKFSKENDGAQKLENQNDDAQKIENKKVGGQKFENEEDDTPKADRGPKPKTVKLSIKNKEFYGDRRWPNGIVPYVIANEPDYSTEDVRKRIEEVNEILKSKTCARLQELTEEETTKYQDYLVLDTSPDFVTGHVGGKQNFGVMDLFNGGQHRQHGAMMVMAMLGFYFEVSRHDRDKYIRVHNRHIRADKLHHFEKIREDATFPLPYDYKSAMHPAWQFWREVGRAGISSIATYKEQDPDGTLMKSLGQNEELLSELDILKINSVYGTRCFRIKSKKKASNKNDAQDDN